MARVGGRNSFIAVPVGLVCLAVVAGLVWLSLPMLPVAGAWVLETARTAISPPEPAAVAPPSEEVHGADAMDCRGMYPDALWAELTWRGGALLTQNAAAPATSVDSLVDALAPAVKLTCAWAYDGAPAIASTLATVAPDAVPIAEAALRGQGFSCTAADGDLHCARTRGVVVEDHSFRNGLWLMSVVRAWHPDDYCERLATFVWG